MARKSPARYNESRIFIISKNLGGLQVQLAIPTRSYLLAEALRHVEEAAGTACDDTEAGKQALDRGISFTDRICIRAEVLAVKLGLDVALLLTAGRIRFVIFIGAAICFVIGIGATRMLPEGFPARANVVSLLAILLLPNLASLMLWLVLTVYSRLDHAQVRTSGWLGRQALGFYGFLESVLDTDAHARAAGRAWRDYLTSTAAGRHRLVITSHLFWSSALLGALSGCWWLLIVRQVDFVWGSTLLNAEHVASLLSEVINWVAGFGFTVPSTEDIIASRIDVDSYSGELRQRWGIFILGAIVTLGLLPRVVAIIVDAIGLLHAGKKLSPDLAHPGYVRLRTRLMPVTGTRSIIDPDDGAMPGRRIFTGTGELSKNIPPHTAWLALEHPPEQQFPVNQTDFDLGIVTSYADQQRAIERLATTDPAWQAVSVYADLAITPDRGIARHIQALVAASTRPVHLVLGQSARATAMPAADLKMRREDWLQTALDAGVTSDRIHQYDQ